MRLAVAWRRFWFTPGQAEDLAICRILFAAGMFLVGLSQPIHEWGDVPAFYHRPALFLRLLGVPVMHSAVLQGMEVVDKIASVKTTTTREGMENVPVTPVLIIGITEKK